ncbi:hypothetical protein Vadar_002117 [Vaccinium darrowii]|uniref:Uncharacterized protein n=1 Tax=Vaccinium darrowii TaxID=229202 RepID=A0ACB7Z1M7_9ERIC|nr:hypothetical protein Vadar_002117 [Vaccinium darrowii]
MGSKTIVFLGLLLATLLLISSEVTARDLAAEETSTFKETAGQTNNGVEDAKYGGGYGGGPGGGYGGGPGGGYGGGPGGGYGGGPGGGYGGGGRGGGYCRYRCCRRGYYGCDRCCSYEGEAEEKGN